jgi:hypothetical protein
MAQAKCVRASHPQAMLTEIYIEALLVDEELADQEFEAWDKGEISDLSAFLMWRSIADSPACSSTNPRADHLSRAALYGSAAPGE